MKKTFLNLLKIALPIFLFLQVGLVNGQGFITWNSYTNNQTTPITGNYPGGGTVEVSSTGTGNNHKFFNPSVFANLNNPAANQTFGTSGSYNVTPLKSLTFTFSTPVIINELNIADIDRSNNWNDAFTFSNVTFTSVSGANCDFTLTGATPTGNFGNNEEYAQWLTSTTAIFSFTINFPTTANVTAADIYYSIKVTIACAAFTTAPTLSATTITNTCPATTVDLTTITASNTPANTTLTWHTATPATDANKIAAGDLATRPAGTYFAAFFDATNNCYSGSAGNATTQVVASLNSCDLDGDLIADIRDIDDDNDGVLDITECHTVLNQVFPTSGDLTDNVPGWVVGGTYAASGPWASTVGRIHLVGSNPPGLLFRREAGTISSISKTFSNFPANSELQLTNFFWRNTATTGAAGTAILEISLNNVLYATINTGTSDSTVPVVATFNGALASVNNLPTVSGVAISAPIQLNIAIPNVLLPTATLKIEFKSGTSPTDGDDIGFSGVTILDCAKDTDGDGIPNHYDLDSDNDGCSDAIESGSSTIAISTTVYPTGTDTNNNGLLNVYEGSTAGTINYTSTYDPFALNDTQNSCAVSLPVEFLTFNAVCNDENEVTIRWATASENNSSHFMLRKSKNGTDWQVISTVQAAGYSNNPIYYSFLDQNKYTNIGMNYYQLIQYDINGVFKILDIIHSNCDEATPGNKMKVVPNPSNGKFTLQFILHQDEMDATVSISDYTGKIVFTEIHEINKGINQLHFEKYNLQNGMYNITVKTNNFSETLKFTIENGMN